MHEFSEIFPTPTMHTQSKPARPAEWSGWKSLWEVLSCIADERTRKEIYDSLLKKPPTDDDPVVVISAYHAQALRNRQIPLPPVPIAVFKNPAAFDTFTVDQAKAQVAHAFYNFRAENLEGRGVAFRFATRHELDTSRKNMSSVIQYPQNNINWAFYTGEGPARGPASPPTINSFLITEVKPGRGAQERGAVCMTSDFNFFMFQ